MDRNESMPCPFPMRESDREAIERRVMARLRWYAEFAVEVKNFYKAEKGKPRGLRHTHPRCIHGVSRWVSYDCACFACEEGYGSWNFVREVTDAVNEWAYARLTVDRRAKDAIPLLMASGSEKLPKDVREGIVKWVLAPTTEF